MPETTAKPPLSEQIFRQIRSQILKGELQAGQPIPSERDLVQQLKMNRGAIREAIKRLQQSQLVRVRHGGATLVESFERTAGLELLPELLINEQGRINFEVAKGMVQMRKALAPAVAASAAEQGGATLAAELDVTVSRMRQTSDLKTLQHLAFDYWTAVVQGCGNVAFKLAFNSMNRSYLAAWDVLTHIMADEFKDTETLHQLSLAIRNREARRCEVLARQHVELGSRALSKALDILANPANALTR